MDGGALTNVPVETALSEGAGEMIILSLNDSRLGVADSHNLGTFVTKLINATEKRQLQLELMLAEARRVKVHLLELNAATPIQIWDFRRTNEAIQCGYEITQKAIQGWERDSRDNLLGWLNKIKDL